MSKKIKLLATLMILPLVFGGLVLAQDVDEDINLDEDIQAQDLGVSEPNILPDSPIYFLKNWNRAIQSFFTFDPVDKANLKEKFANEKLIELKKMVEENKNRERVEAAIENYQNEIEEVKRTTEKIRERAEESVEVGKFLDKFIQQQTLHQRILQKLETQIPQEVLEKIEEARKIHLENFGEVMNRLENKEKIQERLEKNLKEIKGSEFKDFKNLEILKDLEEKVPEQMKEAVRKIQENTLMQLKEKFEAMPVQTQERFQEYIEKMGGEKEGQMEILENLKEELKETPKITEMLIQSRERIMEQVRTRTQEKECQEIEKPSNNFCNEGRILIKKDENGCIVSFDCVIPEEVEGSGTICISLYDPVCGKNGKTYSNKCFANAAGVEIDYEGACDKNNQGNLPQKLK
ncbi:DUF5667 domain-containing protein [Patescibacteria group bacterium]